MGLASALSTALTGLKAAETVIDVAGNNLANSNTVGFKSSDAAFATQFLQTQSLGSAPTSTSGGTNPRQTGLGTQVAEITPDFTQGTIEISSNPSDLAIQGEGFFVVQGNTGEQLYTRNGIFKTNSTNELVTVSGNRVLGFGVNGDFQLQTTSVVPLTIPLGATEVAQATENVFLEGRLIPNGDVATQAEVIETSALGTNLIPQPALPGAFAVAVPAAPLVTATPTTIASSNSGGGALTAGQTYNYRFTFVDANGTETIANATTAALTQTVGGGDDSITISSLPPDTSGVYSSVNIYRTKVGTATTTPYYLVGTAATGANFVDNNADATGDPVLDNTTINGTFSYYVTFFRTGEPESRPSAVIGPVNPVNDRVHLTTDLLTPPTVAAGIPAYNQVRIYRNLASDPSNFFLVDTIATGRDYTDRRTDAQISDLTVSGNKLLDTDGPKVGSSTLLVDILRQTGAPPSLTYTNVFSQGTITFNPRKGGRDLYESGSEKTFTVSATSTLQEFNDFMTQSMGIRSGNADPQNAIPPSADASSTTGATLSSGSSINNGRIRIVANNGTGNAIEVTTGSLTAVDTSGVSVGSINLGFASSQTAVGESAFADFVAFDSLGIPLNVRITTALESQNGSTTTYRWYADSTDNLPIAGDSISVGTGLIQFDGDGNFVSATQSRVSIERNNIPSASPLEFLLDFNDISGLDNPTSNLSASRQDGSAAGTLSSFIIGEDGVIRGVFSNGITRDLGKVRLARFANPAGLEQRGENLFAGGVNSGLAILGDPGEQGIGTIVAGAVELSNSDIGQNLIDLILASTQYRSNTRVVNSAQQLLDELLNLRR